MLLAYRLGVGAVVLHIRSDTWIIQYCYHRRLDLDTLRISLHASACSHCDFLCTSVLGSYLGILDAGRVVCMDHVPYRSRILLELPELR